MRTIRKTLIVRYDGSMRIIGWPRSARRSRRIRWDEVAFDLVVKIPEQWGKVIGDIEVNVPEPPDAEVLVELRNREAAQDVAEALPVTG